LAPYKLKNVVTVTSFKKKQPRTARSNENIEHMQDLLLSQEDRPQTHLTQREISREVGIFQTSVNKIV